MTSLTGNESRGFTLIELLVVMMLISAIFAVSVPLLRGTYSDAKFHSAARGVTSSLGYAHRLSIMKHKPVRVAFDTSRHSTTIEIQTEKDRFAPIRSDVANEKKLPEQVTFSSVKGPGVETGRRIFYVTFYPDGTADAREITMRGPDGDLFEIAVHPATGSVSGKQI